MKFMKLNYSSKIFALATLLALFSPISSVLALTEVSKKNDSKISDDSDNLILADKDDDDDDDDDDKKGNRRVIKQRRTIKKTNTTTTTTSYIAAKQSAFTLAVWQPAGTVSEVITRVSLKRKHGKKYTKERFLGDYKYKIKQKAKFEKGFKAGDRIVVRLYDLENKFIGYSEFECLPGFTTVNLILSAQPTENQIVRTFYGADTNQDGVIDNNTKTYDYFTQVKNQQVTFLNSSQSINITEFQAAGFSKVSQTSIFPASFTQGEYSLVRQSMSIVNSDLAQALTVNPGSLVEVTEIQENSRFELGKLLTTYRQVGIAKSIQVVFSDVAENYWANNFVTELAAMEIVKGFPDGTFRPEASVTRAEFATLLQEVFSSSKVRRAINFRDVSNKYWAYNSIHEAYQMGFFNISGSKFEPKQNLTRLEVLVALAKALNYKKTSSTTSILSVYKDAQSISSEYRSMIAFLTQKGIMVNYPDVNLLNLDRVATRGEVCALLYRVLVSKGQVVDIASEYTVKSEQKTQTETQTQELEESKVKPIKVKEKRPKCNQGIGNGSEGCDPGNSRPHGGSNDEGGRTPGRKK